MWVDLRIDILDQSPLASPRGPNLQRLVESRRDMKHFLGKALLLAATLATAVLAATIANSGVRVAATTNDACQQPIPINYPELPELHGANLCDFLLSPAISHREERRSLPKANFASCEDWAGYMDGLGI